jgi:nucleotide-binding universal stress UspA family protein
MPSIRSILVPVDFSDCSAEVVEHAAELARGLGAQLRVLHVVDPPGGIALDTPLEIGQDGRDTQTVIEYLADDAEQRLPRYLEQLDNVSVQSMVRIGPPADTIVDAADEIGADLIVMGTHGRTGLAHMLLGSVAEQVLRRTRRPVVTIRSEHGVRCKAKSCNWCNSGVTEAERRVRAEADG